MQSVPTRRYIVSSHAVQEESAQSQHRGLVDSSSGRRPRSSPSHSQRLWSKPQPDRARPSDSPFLLLPADVVARLPARDLLWKAPPATPSLALELDIRALEAQLATAPLEGIAAAPLELALPLS